MFKKTMLLLSMALYAFQMEAGQYSIYLTIQDPTIISHVNLAGKPVFTVSGINNIVDQYTVTGFAKAFPGSRFRDMRNVYKMEVSSLQLAEDLKTTYNQYFPYYEVIQKSIPAYTPVDFPNLAPFRNTDYLKYINAEAAWDVSKGDSSIIIGITDTYLDTTHPDLIKKYIQATPNIIDPNLSQAGLAHGTFVSGLAAARTDSSLGSPFYGGYPSIGFNCKIDFSCIYYTPEMSSISKRPGRRILNGSWVLSTPTYALDQGYFLTEQIAYQEIYENGVFSVFSAGNSDRFGLPWWYCYPASLDYVFSVSGVNHVNTSGTYNVKGMHEATIGDTTNRIGHHNTRVDLLAPYNDLGGLAYDPFNPNTIQQRYILSNSWGTSWASPIVAGTAGLILSKNSCYTPYQLEYILKKSANSSILLNSANLKYNGRLGAGALDAGKALAMIDPLNTNPGIPHTNCNDPLTTTFFIEGLDINTICAPGYSLTATLPTLKPVLRNGSPNYTYRWEYLPGNNVTLSSLTVANPQIMTSTGNRKAVLRLTVYDGSSVQKVASRRFTIQLSTTYMYDFAGADSYMDMFNEPNEMDLLDPRDDNYYMSPDLWNRQTNDGLTDHQNAEYYATDSNYAHVKIRNVGCWVGYNHYLKLYWTVASTGENWKNDWDGTTKLTNAAGVPNSIAGGGEITSGSGIPISGLDPGKDTVIRIGWRAPKPQDYSGTPNDLNVCLLARIVAPVLPNDGMHTQEVTGPIITNVRNNNNIFTRNLWVKDLNPFNRTGRTRVLIANANNYARAFDIQFINDRAINLHFAGNYSAIGKVTFYLGDAYTFAMAYIKPGSYLYANPDTKTVVTDGSTTLEFLNLPISANTRFPVDIEFSLHQDIAIPNYRYDFHLRQFARKPLDEGGGRSDNVYGSMSFRVNTHSSSEDGYGGKALSSEKATVTNKSSFSVYPNPVTDKLVVSYLSDEERTVDLIVYDITGRKMLLKTDQYFKNSFVELPVTEFVPGVYFIKIINSSGVNERFKFIKQ